MKTTNYRPEDKAGFIAYLTNEANEELLEIENDFKNGKYSAERWYNCDKRNVKENLTQSIEWINDNYGVDNYKVSTIKKYMKMFGGKGFQTKYSRDGGEWETQEITLGNNSKLRKSPTRQYTGRNF